MSTIISQRDQTSVTFDGTLQMSAVRSYRPTQHPVEETATRPAGTISDGKIEIPRTFSIQFVQTETPSVLGEGESFGVAHVTDLLDWLNDHEGDLLTIQPEAGLPVVEDYTLVNLSISRGLRNAIEGIAQFSEITIVESRQVSMPERVRAPGESLADATAEDGSGGSQSTTESNKSIGAIGFDAAVEGARNFLGGG